MLPTPNGGKSAEDALREAYREPSVDDGARRPQNVLAYFPGGERKLAAVATYSLLAALLVFASVAGVSGSALLGSLGAALTVAWFFWRRRQRKVVPRALLRVEGSSLRLSGPAFRQPVTLELSELLDVYLDTDENDVSDGDRARIALELEHDALFLTDERTPHLDAHEWFGKVRSFLRKHGWVPGDER